MINRLSYFYENVIPQDTKNRDSFFYSIKSILFGEIIETVKVENEYFVL